MASFVDAKGREWQIAPTWPELEQFFIEKKIDPLAGLNQPMAMAMGLLHFTRIQRSKAKVDETDFLGSINESEEVAMAAGLALNEAVAVFLKARTA